MEDARINPRNNVRGQNHEDEEVESSGYEREKAESSDDEGEDSEDSETDAAMPPVERIVRIGHRNFRVVV